MRLRKALVLTVSALLLSGAGGELLNPSPRPTQKPSESTAFSNQQASQQPTPVKTSNPSNAPNSASAAAQEQDQAPDTSTIVIAFSAVVSAIAAALIAWFNWQLVGVTEEMTKATAQSAETAIAALEISRPFLLVIGMSIKFPNRPEGNLYVIHVQVKNFGTGPADVRDYVTEVERMNYPTGLTDPSAWHPPDDGKRPDDPLIMGGEEPWDRFDGAIMLNPQEFAELKGSRWKLRIEGRIRYKGVGRKEYVTKFYWWYHPPIERSEGMFVRSFEPGYNDYT
jgi:hypothetical protein